MGCRDVAQCMFIYATFMFVDFVAGFDGGLGREVFHPADRAKLGKLRLHLKCFGLRQLAFDHNGAATEKLLRLALVNAKYFCEVFPNGVFLDVLGNITAEEHLIITHRSTPITFSRASLQGVIAGRSGG